MDPSIAVAVAGHQRGLRRRSSDEAGSPANESQSGAEEPSEEERVVIEEAVTNYFAAATGDEACETMTEGLASHIAGSEPSGDPEAPAGETCPAGIEGAEERGEYILEPIEVEIQEVLVDGERAAVRVVNEQVADDRYPVFLVSNGDEWFVMGDGSPPPGFEDLHTQIQ